MYSSPSVIRIFKSRRMEWAGYVACLGGKRKAYKTAVGKLEETNYLEVLDADRNKHMVFRILKT